MALPCATIGDSPASVAAVGGENDSCCAIVVVVLLPLPAPASAPVLSREDGDWTVFGCGDAAAAAASGERCLLLRDGAGMEYAGGGLKTAVLLLLLLNPPSVPCMGQRRVGKAHSGGALSEQSAERQMGVLPPGDC